MLIKKSDANKIENNSSCVVWEYDVPSELFSFGTSKINGRYPKEGSCSNLECEEIYYVMSGSGTIHSQKGEFGISVGDVYFFEKGETYWVEGDDLLLALVNSPKWTPEQHIIK